MRATRTIGAVGGARYHHALETGIVRDRLKRIGVAHADRIARNDAIKALSTRSVLYELIGPPITAFFVSPYVS